MGEGWPQDQVNLGSLKDISIHHIRIVQGGVIPRILNVTKTHWPHSGSSRRSKDVELQGGEKSYVSLPDLPNLDDLLSFKKNYFKSNGEMLSGFFRSCPPVSSYFCQNPSILSVRQE